MARLAAVALAILAQVGGTFTANPTSLNFGTVPPGTVSASQSVTLSSPPGGPSGVVNSMSVTPSDFRPVGSCVDHTVSPTAPCTVSFQFAPTAPGTVNGTATFVVSETTITVALTGVGAAPTTTTTTTTVPTTTPPTTGPPTTEPPPTEPPPPGSTTPTTRPRATTTSSSSTTSTSSTSPSSTTALRPATTTTTTLQSGPGGPPTLRVFTSTGRSNGPAGIGVTITGAGYAVGTEQAAGAGATERGAAAGGICDTVYFHLGGTRIGSAQPDSSGNVRASGLSVPGDTDTGRHTVTSSCNPSGAPELADAGFVVTDASFHRAAFVTAIHQPSQIEITPAIAAASVFGVVALLFLTAFPAELFNSTLEENRAEVRAWFHLRTLGPEEDEEEREGNAILFASFVALSGPLYFLINPRLHLDAGVLAGAFGLSAATGLVTLASDLPTYFFVRRQFQERGRLDVVPGSIWVALVCVVLSRAVRFQPGYFYGLIAGLIFSRRLRDDESGRLAAVSAGLLLVLSIGSWFALGPISHVARQDGAPVWAIFVEAVLGGVFWVALDSLVIALMPLRFLQGNRIKNWSSWVWAVLYGSVLLAFVHILLRPGSGYVADTRTSPAILVVGLFVGFAVFSVAFWAYFRYRRPRS